MKRIFTSLLTVCALTPSVLAADIVFQAGQTKTEDNLPAPVIIKNVDTNAGDECLSETKDPFKAYYSDFSNGNYTHIEYKVSTTEAGIYEMAVYTATMNERFFYAKVNDDKPTIFKPTETSDWGWRSANAVSKALVNLKEGDNTLVIEQAPLYLNGSRGQHYFPNIYKFEFTKVDSGSVESQEEIFIEAEDFVDGSASREPKSERPNFNHSTDTYEGVGAGLDGKNAVYNITVNNTGYYLMRIWYAYGWNTGQDRGLTITVPGYPEYVMDKFPETGEFGNADGFVEVAVYLEKGENEVKLTGTSQAPIVDCFVLEAVNVPWLAVPEKVSGVASYTVLAKDYENANLSNVKNEGDVIGESDRLTLGYSDYEADNANIGAKYTIKDVAKAGVYTMTVYTACADNRNFFVRLNDSKGIVLKSANNDTWNKDLASCTGEVSAKVWLKEGDNSLMLARYQKDFMPGVGKFVFEEDPFSELTESDFAGEKIFIEAEDFYAKEGTDLGFKDYSKGEGGRAKGISFADGKTDGVYYYSVNAERGGNYMMRLWHSDYNGDRNNNIQVLGYADVLTVPTPGSESWDDLASGLASAVVTLNPGVNVFAIKHGTTNDKASLDCYEFELIDGVNGPAEAEVEAPKAGNSEVAGSISLSGLEGELNDVDSNEYSFATLKATVNNPTITFNLTDPIILESISWASATPGAGEWSHDVEAPAGKMWNHTVESFGLLHTLTLVEAADGIATLDDSEQPASNTVKSVTLTLNGVNAGDTVTIGHFDVKGTSTGTTKVETLNSESNFKVVGRTLYLNGEGEYSVYSLNGIAVACGVIGGNGTAVELNQGIYIVKAGNSFNKIIVR